MSTFSGRRPNERLRNMGKGLLEGLSYVGTALADGPKHDRIKEIDRLLIDLKQERDHLINSLIEPGDLRVSDEFDPNWTNRISVSRGEGRLTACPGSWKDNDPFDRSHPACPYRKTQHNKHEFTARD